MDTWGIQLLQYCCIGTAVLAKRAESVVDTSRRRASPSHHTPKRRVRKNNKNWTAGKNSRTPPTLDNAISKGGGVIPHASAPLCSRHRIRARQSCVELGLSCT